MPHNRTLSWVIYSLLLTLLSACGPEVETEGGITRPYLIRVIRLEGVEAFTVEQISEYTHMGVSSSWPWGEDFLYDESLARVDAERLGQLCRAFGYYKAEILGVELSRLEPDEDGLPWDARVTVKVVEGPQARIVEVRHIWPPEAEPHLKALIVAGVVAGARATGASPSTSGASVTPWRVGLCSTNTGWPVPVTGVRSRVGLPCPSSSVKKPSTVKTTSGPATPSKASKSTVKLPPGRGAGRPRDRPRRRRR